MQARQNQLHRRNADLVHLHRNPPAIIPQTDRAIRVNVDPDVFAVARQVLVNGIIHHLKHTMVQPSLIRIPDIHPRAKPHRFQPFELLNLVCPVGLVSSYGRGV